MTSSVFGSMRYSARVTPTQVDRMRPFESNAMEPHTPPTWADSVRGRTPRGPLSTVGIALPPVVVDPGVTVGSEMVVLRHRRYAADRARHRGPADERRRRGRRRRHRHDDTVARRNGRAGEQRERERGGGQDRGPRTNT
jgi:hypothetical protein